MFAKYFLKTENFLMKEHVIIRSTLEANVLDKTKHIIMKIKTLE